LPLENKNVPKIKKLKNAFCIKIIKNAFYIYGTNRSLFKTNTLITVNLAVGYCVYNNNDDGNNNNK